MYGGDRAVAEFHARVRAQGDHRHLVDRRDGSQSYKRDPADRAHQHPRRVWMIQQFDAVRLQRQNQQHGRQLNLEEKQHWVDSSGPETRRLLWLHQNTIPDGFNHVARLPDGTYVNETTIVYTRPFNQNRVVPWGKRWYGESPTLRIGG